MCINGKMVARVIFLRVSSRLHELRARHAFDAHIKRMPLLAGRKFQNFAPVPRISPVAHYTFDFHVKRIPQLIKSLKLGSF